MGQAREPKEPEEKARRRMAVILQVEAGLMTATDGAKALGISRQAYYEWSNRALSSMADALADRPNGRPAQEADKEKENLAKKLAETKADLDLSQKYGQLCSPISSELKVGWATIA